jgi:hypothetical protein
MKFLLTFIFANILILLTSGIKLYAQTTNNFSQQNVKAFPDWSEFSFSNLESAKESGSVPTEVDGIVGWKASRNWNTGDAVADVIKLGDLEGSLSPQLYSLDDIYSRVNGAELNPNMQSSSSSVPENITLKDFSIVGNQTLESLVKAIPELAAKSAAEVLPISELLTQNGYGNSEATLRDLINDPQIKNLQLNSINLQQYSVDSIPGLTDTQLEKFEDYEDSNVSEIPGLDQLSFSDYPNPIQAEISFVGRIDFIWGEAESKANRTISGSKIEGFKVPCDNNCAHLELDDIENFGRKITSEFEGDQWIRGRDHWVAGGTGCLSGGREPTGIHPFGDTFKSVLWETDEPTDSAQLVMYFNIKTNCGDSAYYIGPFPFPLGNIKINDYIFLGS